MAALAPHDVTDSAPLPSLSRAVTVQFTDVAPTTSEYRQIGTGVPGGRTDTDAVERPQFRPVRTAEAAPSPSAPKRQSVKGVVDHIDGERAHVTLSYAGRPNGFLLDSLELSSAGAGYPGALFEIIITTDFGYTIVHLAEEEAAARNAAPPPDLAFLD